ncbi:MAG: radical SAM protein [Bacillota bacterium]
MTDGIINRIIDFSPIDGPGNRTVIFLQGCNLDCIYCHNPETIKCYKSENVPEDLKVMTAAQLISKIEPNFPYIKGITISGGEPLLQADFLQELFALTEQQGLTNFIDSNASLPLSDKQDLLRASDGFLLDLKAADTEDYIIITGKKWQQHPFLNLELLYEQNLLYEVRTVILPGLIDYQKNIQMIAKKIVSLHPGILYKLISYRDHGVRAGFSNQEPGHDFMGNLVQTAQAEGCTNIKIV